MPLNRQQCLSKLRGAARRVAKSVKLIEETPRGLINLSAHGELHEAAEDIAQCCERLTDMNRRACKRRRA